MPSTKTDNHHLGSKLALRRYFLDKYHAGGFFHVFDCCQGGGRVWKELRKSYQCGYWGVDLKPAKGRLMVDSVRVLELGQFADVIDVDTYGSPWAHWRALLPNVSHDCTVFLTEGMVVMNGIGGSLAGEVLDAAGLRFPTLKPPPSLVRKAIADEAWRYTISEASRRHGLHVAEIVEALNPGGKARYFGVRLTTGTP